MNNRYYLDSAIWMDLHEDRKDKFRPLGEFAFEFLRKVRESEDKIIYSEFVIDELTRYFDKKIIYELFKIVSDEGLLEKAEIREQQLEEAAKLCRNIKIPFGDCLHAILARDNNAVMVTRDRHFEELQGIVEIKKPEQLI